MNFVDELKWRGMIHDIMPGTEELLKKEKTSGYIGFDPTADSSAYWSYGAGYAAGSFPEERPYTDRSCWRSNRNDRRPFRKIGREKSAR